MKRRLVFIVPALVVFLFFLWCLWSFFYSPVFGEDDSCIVVPKGSSVKTIQAILQRADAKYPHYSFRLYLVATKQTASLSAGEYCFSNHDSTWEVIQKLTAGKVKIHIFRLIDGWTYADVLTHLGQANYLKQDLPASQSKLKKLLGVKHSKLEGLFLPDSYYVHRDSDATTLLIRAHRKMSLFVNEAWKSRSKRVPYRTSYQALIAASIIQKESADKADRRLISSVIINRLQKRMFLQMDPTVMYGLQLHRLLHHADLKKNTPYNSYRHIGLPPTPICMPGKDAIIAALHPADTTYLYFVAKGDGSHQFSHTLAEQRMAVSQYILHREKGAT
jgi:UPF0755 protein